MQLRTPSSLEQKLRAVLDHASRVRISLNQPKPSGIVDVIIGNRIVGVIEKIQELESQLRLYPFGQLRVLQHR